MILVPQRLLKLGKGESITLEFPVREVARSVFVALKGQGLASARLDVVNPHGDLLWAGGSKIRDVGFFRLGAGKFEAISLQERKKLSERPRRYFSKQVGLLHVLALEDFVGELVAENSISVGTPNSIDGISAGHTVSVDAGTGSDRLMLAGIAKNTAATIDAFTYNANALTAISGADIGSSPSSALYYYIAPATGPHDLVSDLAGAGGRHSIAGVPMDGVDQTTPAENGTAATGTSSPATVDVTSATGNLVVDLLMWNHSGAGGTTTKDASQDIVIDRENYDGARSWGMSSEAGDTTVTMSWTGTQVSGSTWVLSAASIKAAAAASGDIAGTVAGTSSATGTMAGPAPMVGTAAGTSSASSDSGEPVAGITVGTVASVVGFGNTRTVNVDAGTASNRCMVAAIMRDQRDISAITYNGVAMTLIGQAGNGGSTGPGASRRAATLYRALAPATGVHALTVTFVGDCNACLAGIPLAGVDQTTPNGTIGTATGTASPITVDAGSGSGQRVIDAFFCKHSSGGSTTTVGAGQTVLVDRENWAGAESAGVSIEDGSTTTTMSWTATNVDSWAQIAVSFNPVAVVPGDINGTALGTSTATNTSLMAGFRGTAMGNGLLEATAVSPGDIGGSAAGTSAASLSAIGSAEISGVAYGGASPGNITLAWDANTEPDLAGYKIYIGLESMTFETPPGEDPGPFFGVYESPVDVGLVTQFTLQGLPGGVTYYFALTAYDTELSESAFSNEVVVAVESYTLPTGTLTSATVMVGTAAGFATASGTMLASAEITGTAAGTSFANGLMFGASTSFRDGQADGTSTAAATLTGTGAMVGTAAGTGALTHSGIAGTATGTGLAVGSLIGLAATSAAGAAAGEGLGSATLTGTAELIGTSAGTGLARHSGIYGSTAGSATAIGSMIGLAATSAAGVISGAGAASATLLGAGELEGTAEGSSSLTHSGIEGTAAGTSDATASLGAENIAAGVAAGVGAVAATLAGTGALIGSAAGTSTLIHSGIRGSVAGTSFATGTMFSASTSMATGVATGTGTASATLRGAGTLAGQSAGVGLLRHSGIAGSTAGTSFATGLMFAISTSSVVGVSAGESSAAAELLGSGALAGQADGVGSTGHSGIEGTATGTGNATGNLVGLGSTSAIGETVGSATATATLAGTGALDGTSAGTSALTAPGDGGELPIDGLSAGVSLSEATLLGTAELIGLVVGQASVSVDGVGSSLIFGNAEGLALLDATLLGTGRLEGTAAGNAPIVTLVRTAPIGQLNIARMKHSRARPEHAASPKR